MSDHLELVKDNRGIRQLRLHTLDIGWRHIHAHCTDSFWVATMCGQDRPPAALPPQTADEACISPVAQDVLVFHERLLHPAVALLFVGHDTEGHRLRTAQKLLNGFNGGDWSKRMIVFIR